MSKKKYNTEFKLEIVQHYQKGSISFKELAEIYFVNKGDVQNGMPLIRNMGLRTMYYKWKLYW